MAGRVRAALAAWAYGWARCSRRGILYSLRSMVLSTGIGAVSARAWHVVVAAMLQQAACGACVQWLASRGCGQGRLSGSVKPCGSWVMRSGESIVRVVD